MRYFTNILSWLLLLLLLAACSGGGGGGGGGSSSSSSGGSSAAPADTPTDTAASATSSSSSPDASSPSASEQATQQQSDDGGVIRVGVFPDPCPFECAGADGELVGFDIDLMQAIAHEAGFDIEFVQTRDWEAIFRAVDEGKFDVVISSATILEEREQWVNFSDPYFNAGLAITVQEGSTIAGPADLDNQQVAVLGGSTGETWVAENTKAEAVVYSTVTEMFEELEKGNVDAVVIDSPFAMEMVREKSDLTMRTPLLTQEWYGIAVSKERPELLAQINEALATVQRSGEYERIHREWFGSAPGEMIASGADGEPSTTDASSGTGTEETASEGTEASAEATGNEESAASAETAADEVTISIVYGSEKQEWLEPLVEAYNQAAHQTPGGSTIVVSATAMGSIESAEAIVAGTLQATVWSPASTLYVPLAEEGWQAAGHSSELIVETPQELVRSPVVIAMWEPMARALGWPDTSLGWSTIHDLAGTDWAEYGHPEWGTFKFGHTHPDRSNSGLAALLAEAYAGAGRQENLSTANLNTGDVRAFVSQIETSIIDYGRSTGFFARRMFDCEIGGPSFLSAAVLYENLVAAQEQTCAGQPRLVAIYPQEGTFWSNHPYVILNAPWVSAEQKTAAQDFAAFLLARPQQERALQSGFRPAVAGIPLEAPMDAEHGVDITEPRVVLEVPSAEVIQYAQTMWRETKKAADVVVVMDISNSMWAEDKIGQAQQAMLRFIEMLGDTDRLQIVVFNDSITTLSPLSPLGEKRAELERQIMSIQPAGPTRLYDATLAAYTTLKTEGDPAHIRAVVVMTDGKDELIAADGTVLPGSEQTLADVLAQIHIGEEGGNAVKLFTIAYGSEADREVMQQMAQTTGGEQFDAGVETIRKVYEQIAVFF
jgi:Ca-activated chloride channel family protein